MALKINEIAPKFNLKDKDGKYYRLEDFKNKIIVLYFYPKDSTAGCTIEAIAFSKSITKFEKLDAQVIGISGGDERTKEKFCKRFNLKVLLLSDSDFKISKKYKVYGKKSFLGKHFFGIMRVTYILDKNKKVIKVFEKVKPFNHANEVLKFIKD
jgi:thioredoxin-dependent peroxiredoxin